MFSNLSLKGKILLPVVLIAAILSTANYFIISDIVKSKLIEEAVGKASSIISAAEGAREWTASQAESDLFFTDSLITLYNNGDITEDDILKTIPIVASMTVLKNKAKEMDLAVKVPRRNPRNPDNEPDEFEKKALDVIYSAYEKDKSDESLFYYEVFDYGNSDDDDDSLRFFKGIKLTDDCMACHGDPANSYDYWGRADGKDILGFKLDNKKTGDLHGAFEIKLSMMPVYENINSSSNAVLLISLVLLVLLTLTGYFIGTKIANPLDSLRNVTSSFAKGDLEARPAEYKGKDAIGRLSKDISNMQDDIQKRIALNDKMVKFQDEESRRVLEIIQKLDRGENQFDKITIETDDDTKEMGNIMQGIQDALFNLGGTFVQIIQGLEHLINSAKQGKLEERMDPETFKGSGKHVINLMNDLMENVDEPISDTQLVLNRMASGDLTAKVLNQYQGKFDELKTYVNQLSDSFTSSFSEIDDAVKTASSTAQELSSLAESMSASSHEQSAQASDVAAAVEEMSATISDNNSTAQKTTELAHENLSVATEGGERVSETVSKMKDIADVVSTSAKSVENLGAASEEIGEIVSVIEEIADQTNLLALNAAIEAARAGEQGRGFAVVADEVRKLAERTTEATQQIAKMIKDIQIQTTEAVRAMEKGNTEVDTGIQMADRAGEALQKILGSTQELMNQIAQLSAASNEQAAASNEISRNVSGISEVTNDTSNQVQDVSAASDQLSEMTEDLANMIAKFKISNDPGAGNLLDIESSRNLLE